MAARKLGGLGKGLDALISAPRKEEPAQKETKKPASAASPKKKTKIEKAAEPVKKSETAGTKPASKEDIIETRDLTVRIDEIEPNRNQPRKDFDDEQLAELADSIKTHGIIQPLIVTRSDDGYSLIAGERRWRAARMAGLTEVPVIIKDYTPSEAVEIALIENIQRQDLNPVEEALAYQNLIEEYGLRQEDVADRVSKSRTAVANSLRLLKLDPRVMQMVVDGMISAGHARALLPITDPDLRYSTAMKVFDHKLSVRDTERLVNVMQKPRKIRPVDTGKIAVYKALEDRMKSALGSKVTIKAGTKNRGRIEIDFYSSDDLERITDILTSYESGN
ncbi:MAG: ParB/RepB/Spo0J family partition protein [Lachnospiraceae bacterium]|nr:ParB/RepB/Spo0J family partition protein [Lachnospiraceae bacterium]